MLETLMPGLHSAPHIHPLFVHFPVVLCSVALLFWTIAIFGKREHHWVFGLWLIYLGALFSLMAAGTGLWAEDQLGHQSPGHGVRCTTLGFE